MIIWFIVGIMLIILSYFRFNKIINPISTIFILFFAWTFLSKLGLFNTYKTSSASTNFILFNILIMLLVFFLISIKRNKSYKDNIVIKNIEENRIVTILRICFLPIGLFVFLKIIILVLSGTISYDVAVRAVAFSSETWHMIYVNDIIRIIYIFGFKGFVLYDIMTQISSFITEKKKINKLSIFNFALYCIGLLSRIELMRIFLFFFLVIIISGYRVRRPDVKSGIRKKPVIILAFILFLVSIFRKTDNMNLLEYTVKSIVVDFTGPFIAFDLFFEKYINGFRVVDSHFYNYFAVLFHGIVRMINIVTKEIGWDITSYSGILSEYSSLAIRIGPNQSFNAFYTMYFQSLYASGILGSILFSISLGVILGITHNIYQKNKSSITLCLYAFTLHLAVLGSIRWELSNLALWMTLLFIILDWKTRKKIQ